MNKNYDEKCNCECGVNPEVAESNCGRQFKELFSDFIAGAPIKRKPWGGFWKYSYGKVQMHSKDGTVTELKDTKDIIFTLSGILQDDWIIATNENCSVSLLENKSDQAETKTQEKMLDISEVKGAKANISDLKVFGDGDTFALLCKASSQAQGWMKSTKVCNVNGGCIVQVTTQQKNPNGSYAVAEAVTYVPGMKLDKECEPRQLVPIGNIPVLTEGVKRV